MKKLNLLIAMMAIATIGFMSTSCEDDDAVGPSITLTADGITADKTVAPGATFTVAWIANKGDANLAEFTIMRDDQDLSGYPLTDIANDNYQGSDELTAPSNVGTYVYTLKVTDKDDLSDEVSLTITVEQTAGSISTYNVTLGAQGVSTPGTVDLETGTRYALAGDEAKNNAAVVDLLCYYGTQNKATLAAPDDESVDGTGSNSFDWTSTWPSRNATKIGLSTLDFDAQTDDANISGISVSALRVTGLVAGNVLAFETVGGKKGLIKIVSAPSSSSGEMSITIKVQD